LLFCVLAYRKMRILNYIRVVEQVHGFGKALAVSLERHSRKR